MPECARCSDFTDNPANQDYHYCDDCLNHFEEVEDRGVIVEHERNGEVYVMVTSLDEAEDGGTEYSQIEGLARGKYIANETGLPAVFKYNQTGSIWDLDDYLREHPSIRQDVNDRLRKVPDNSSEGLIQRIRNIL